MQLILQNQVSYAKHFSWDLSQRAYQHSGLDNWLSGDVPAFMTGNAALAKQKAEILIYNLNQRSEDTVNITVLELGGGNGLFAWHFIQAFEKLAKTTAEKYRLKYILTDAQTTGLQYLQSIEAFQNLIKRGVLELKQAELFQPTQLSPVTDEDMELPQLDLLLCNYLFCNLPFRLLRWNHDHCEELYLLSSVSLKGHPLSAPITERIQTVLSQNLKDLQTQAWPLSEASLSLDALKTDIGSTYPQLCHDLNKIRDNLWDHLELETSIQKIELPRQKP